MKFNFTSKNTSANIHIIGIPYDASTSYKPGARFGPNTIREASMNLESYSPYLQKDLVNYQINDLGNIAFSANNFGTLSSDFDTLFKPIDFKTTKLLTLGGEHSIAIMPLRHYLQAFPNLAIIHLDAHTDLRSEYYGDPNSHACIMKNVYDLFSPTNQLIQYGIRSGSKEEFDWMQQNGTLVTSRQELLARVSALDCPIYLTLDIDFFDPSVMPGTGTPEAGGEDFHFFISLIKLLNQKNLVGADVVELAPKIDPSGISEANTAKICRELLLAMAH